MKEFLKRYIPTEKGDVLDADGNVVGTHDGARLYTLGERHGFLITKKSPNDLPQYIVAKNIADNTITVAPKSAREETAEATLAHVSFISSEAPKEGEVYNVRFRYRQPLTKARCKVAGGRCKVGFESPQTAITPGQSLVIYHGDECIGGGVIV